MKTIELAIWAWHNGGFKNYSFPDILLELQTKKSAVVTEAGKIVACATGEVIENTFRVRNVISTNKDGLKALVRIWRRSEFAKLTLTGNRRGKEVVYDTSKLLRRFSL